MSQSTDADTFGRGSLTTIVGVVADVQTYKNLLYLFLSFPLGLVYYIILVIGFTAGVGLSILVVGLGILLATVIGVRLIASFERGLANTLLGTELANPDDVETNSDGLIETAKAYLQAGSTWRGLGFVTLKFWLGILSFVLLVSFLGTAIDLLMLPVFSGGVLNVEVAGWEVTECFQTDTQRAAAVPAGVILTLIALHVLNAFAKVNASIASALLVPGRSGTDEQTQPV